MHASRNYLGCVGCSWTHWWWWTKGSRQVCVWRIISEHVKVYVWQRTWSIRIGDAWILHFCWEICEVQVLGFCISHCLVLVLFITVTLLEHDRVGCRWILGQHPEPYHAQSGNFLQSQRAILGNSGSAVRWSYCLSASSLLFFPWRRCTRCPWIWESSAVVAFEAVYHWEMLVVTRRQQVKIWFSLTDNQVGTGCPSRDIFATKYPACKYSCLDLLS
jgi:hypothetical protein